MKDLNGEIEAFTPIRAMAEKYLYFRLHTWHTCVSVHLASYFDAFIFFSFFASISKNKNRRFAKRELPVFVFALFEISSALPAMPSFFSLLKISRAASRALCSSKIFVDFSYRLVGHS